MASTILVGVKPEQMTAPTVQYYSLDPKQILVSWTALSLESNGGVVVLGYAL